MLTTSGLLSGVHVVLPSLLRATHGSSSCTLGGSQSHAKWKASVLPVFATNVFSAVCLEESSVPPGSQSVQHEEERKHIFKAAVLKTQLY